MTRDFFENVWDLLVTEGGAPSSERAKWAFVHYFMSHHDGDPELGPTLEYRFGGAFGFGGKFWRNPYPKRCPYYVNYYPEDRTTERDALVGKINMLIEDLYVVRLPSSLRDRYIADAMREEP